MKRYVGEIAIEDLDLTFDIIHALENQPCSGKSYEIEMYERGSVCDPCSPRGSSKGALLKIFVVEGEN